MPTIPCEASDGQMLDFWLILSRILEYVIAILGGGAGVVRRRIKPVAWEAATHMKFNLIIARVGQGAIAPNSAISYIELDCMHKRPALRIRLLW